MALVVVAPWNGESLNVRNVALVVVAPWNGEALAAWDVALVNAPWHLALSKFYIYLSLFIPYDGM